MAYSPQTDALMQRLRPATAQPRAADPFARGGQVKPLPSNGTAEQIANMGGSTAVNLAGKALGNTAAGAAAGSGISLATDALSSKLRTKEEMPTFGGTHGAITDAYGRRFEGTGGGTHANAVKYAGYGANPALAAATGGLSIAAGALFGIGKAAATRNAPSAYSDFRVEDAADALRKGYSQYLGRDASDDEVMGRLVGQGWNPNDGSRWVGEKNLFAQLDDIKNSDEAKAYAARVGAVAPTADAAGAPALADPLGAGGVDPFSAGTQALRTQLAAAPQQPTAAITDGRSIRDASGDAARIVDGGAPQSGQTATTTAPAEWNTDGYAAPAYTPPQAGPVPDGWDAMKWNDPNHQTPKYAVGRILSQFPPTVEGLAAAFPEIEQAYPGATFNGKDRITIPGVGEIDVLKGASKGGEAWRWGADDGAQAAPGADASNAGGASLIDATGGASNQQDVAAIIQALIAREGQRDTGGLTQALMNQLRATA